MFVDCEGKQHHFVSIISFLRGCNPFAVGHDSAGKWGAVTGQVGHDSGEVGQPESGCPVESNQIISGDGSAGTVCAAGVALPACKQRFSISSILRRTCSQ